MGAAGEPGARSPSAPRRPTRTRQLLSSAAWVLTPGPSEVTATAAALGWVLCWWLLVGVLAEHALAMRWMAHPPLLPALAARAGEVVLAPAGLLLAALLVPAVTLAPLGLLGRGRSTARAYAVAIGFALAGVVLVVGAAQSWSIRPQDESFARVAPIGRMAPIAALAGGAAAIGCGLWLANGWRRLVAATLRAPRGSRGEETLRTLVVGGPWVAALVVPTLAVRPLAELVAIGPAGPSLLPSAWTVPATLAALALGVAAALRLRAPRPDEVVAAPVASGAPTPAGDAWHLVVPASVACVVAWWGLLIMLAVESSRLNALLADAGVSLRHLPLLLLLGRWLHDVPSAAMAGIAVPAVVGLALALGARDRRAALTLGLGTVLMPLLAAVVVGEFAEVEAIVPEQRDLQWMTMTTSGPNDWQLPAPWVPTTTFAVAALVLGGVVAAAWGALSVRELRAPRTTVRLELARILAIAVLPTLGGTALAFAATGADGLSRGLVELVVVVSLSAATLARWRVLAR